MSVIFYAYLCAVTNSLLAMNMCVKPCPRKVESVPGLMEGYPIEYFLRTFHDIGFSLVYIMVLLYIYRCPGESMRSVSISLRLSYDHLRIALPKLVKYGYMTKGKDASNKTVLYLTESGEAFVKNALSLL